MNSGSFVLQCAQRGLDATGHPRPGIAVPQGRQQVQPCGLRSPVVHGESNEDVFGRGFRVLDAHVEVAIIVEHPGVDELIFAILAGPLLIGRDEVRIGVGTLRVLVEVLHVRVRRRAVQIEVVLLHVLAVVTFGIGESEEPLLDDGVGSIPQRQGEAQQLLIVAESAQAILPPAVGARTRLVVGEVTPCVAVCAVVFAHGAPLALTEVWTPLLPGNLPLSVLLQALVLNGGNWQGTSIVRRGSLQHTASAAARDIAEGSPFGSGQRHRARCDLTAWASLLPAVTPARCV